MGEKQNQPFQLSFNPSLKVNFQGSRVTSDGGLLLVRELDERLGLSALIAANIMDDRGGKNPQLPLPDLLRQSIYSGLAGYEDVNDAERLSQDPTFRLIAELGGSPPYDDFEDDIIEGNLTIKGLQTCFLGIFRDTITGNVNLEDNVDGDPDGNEIANNSIVDDLSCDGNRPSPQIGDSGGGPNTVFGRARGQCASAALVH